MVYFGMVGFVLGCMKLKGGVVRGWVVWCLIFVTFTFPCLQTFLVHSHLGLTML